MSFKLSTNRKTGVVTVDSSQAGAYDWVMVVLESGITLRFHSLPAPFIDNELSAAYYHRDSSPQKPSLWIDSVHGDPPYAVEKLTNGWPVHHSDLGLALDSQLTIGAKLQLNVMTYHQVQGLRSFYSFATVSLHPVIHDVFQNTVSLHDRALAPTFVVS